MKIIRISQNIPKTIWHISNNEFDKFQPTLGMIWFAKDKNSLIENKHGASIQEGPIYLYQCETTTKNPAGWDEYDKYFVDQIKSLGFDSIDLDEDFVVFDPNHINIISVTKIN